MPKPIVSLSQLGLSLDAYLSLLMLLQDLLKNGCICFLPTMERKKSQDSEAQNEFDCICKKPEALPDSAFALQAVLKRHAAQFYVCLLGS